MLKAVREGDALLPLAKEIDQERINRWAELSGDFNRLHVDPDYARQTPFKGTIAHGPLSLAFLNELMMASFGEVWAESGRLLDVRFLAPVRPGDMIRIGGTVTGFSEEGGKNFVTCDLFVEKDGTKAVVGRGMVPWKGGKP